MREPMTIPNLQEKLSALQSRGGEGMRPQKPKRATQTHHITGARQREWVHPKTMIPFHRLTKLNTRIGELETIIGEKPKDWCKPTYGNLDYTIAERMGWISEEEARRDKRAYDIRRQRSLQTCHTANPGRYGRFKAWTYDLETETVEVTRTAPVQTGAYVPEMNAAVLLDQDLTDGAKICLAKILEETYRNNRDHRWLAVTVPYLMQALNRSRRTIQNYLRLLEHCGYIFCDVLLSEKTRMSNGLKITLNKTAFAKHHQEKWPKKNCDTSIQDDHNATMSDGKSGVQKDSPNYFSQIYIQDNPPTVSVAQWAMKSMMTIYKRFMQNNAPYTPPDIHL